MTAKETAREALHRAIDGLSEQDAEDLLDYLNLRADPDSLTEGELAELRETQAEMARGEYVTREELVKKYGL